MSNSPYFDPETSLSHRNPSKARIMSLLGVVAAGVGLVGFLIGIGDPTDPVRPDANPAGLATNEVPPAPSYRQIPERSFGPNADWESQFSALKQNPPGLFEQVTRTHEMKMEALADRLRTRAFDGAPPVIPHPITQQSADSCLVCHENGLILGDRIATRMSHARFAGCTQCHVESTPSGPFELEQTVANGFTGIARSGPGQRAMTGSPPTIPHTTWMREDCLSCHGLVTRPGLRTTHPWLSNCVQCHAPSAEFDLVPFGPELAEQHPLAANPEEQAP